MIFIILKWLDNVCHVYIIIYNVNNFNNTLYKYC